VPCTPGIYPSPSSSYILYAVNNNNNKTLVFPSSLYYLHGVSSSFVRSSTEEGNGSENNLDRSIEMRCPIIFALRFSSAEQSYSSEVFVVVAAFRKH
jgi:hypothetical protein